MRRTPLLVLAMVVAVGLFAGPAMADLHAEAVKHVYVNVDPDIAVGATSASINGGNIQRGELEVLIPFRIDANKEQVDIYITATPLWKGDDPFNNEVPPIPLCGYAVILPTNANPTGGLSVVTFPVGPSDVHGFPATMFETRRFESSQNGHFSQDVDVIVCWDQNEFEKPVGEYSGYVKLSAWVVMMD